MDERQQAIADVAIPLIAEDLRDARESLRITTAAAAKRAGIDSLFYRRLESGKETRDENIVSSIIQTARSLGLDSVRMSYVEELATYMRYDLSEDRPFTLFVDSISSDLSELKDKGHFVSPYNIFRLVDNIGQDKVVACQNEIDKAIFELWITALFCLNLDSSNRAYYVRPVRDNAPDTEILTADYETANIQVTKIEVTHYSKHSNDIYEIIKKKLMKRYDETTTIVIYTSKNDEISVAELYDLIKKNNPDNRQVEIVTGTGDGNNVRVIPCGEIKSTEKTTEWKEINVDLPRKKAMRYKYDGVIYKARYMRRLDIQLPVFIKEIRLSR